jgi:hypothetical protein
MLMVGDAVQYQFYVATFFQLEGEGEELPLHFNTDTLDNPGVGSLCDDKRGGSLVFLRNDYIAVNQTTEGSRHILHNWTRLALEFDIIILSKAAYQGMSYYDSVQQSIETARFLQTLLVQRPDTRVIYRTTSPGHPHCSIDSKPITDPLLTEPMWLNMTGMTESERQEYVVKLQWDRFSVVNEVTAAIFASFLPPSQFSVLRAAELTALRPDGHRCTRDKKKKCDELHYFLPSVVDSWVLLLQNTLPPLPYRRRKR